MFSAALDVIYRQEWLDTVGDGLGRAVSGVYAAGGAGGRQVKNFLHGTGLGHPLHPVLTDVPLGAWTVALALDALDGISGRDDLAPGADAAVGLGLVGALGAAAAGLTDWQHTDGAPRRLGVAHGLMNVGATALYTISLLYRQRGARDEGRGFATLGYGLSVVAAYLGGHLVFEDRIGVDHAAGLALPREFVPVLASTELPERVPRRAKANEVPIVLVRVGPDVHALAETCPHLGGPLAEGHLEGGGIVCPWHGSRFALADGAVLDGPATYPAPYLEARIRDGQIEVRAVN